MSFGVRDGSRVGWLLLHSEGWSCQLEPRGSNHLNDCQKSIKRRTRVLENGPTHLSSAATSCPILSKQRKTMNPMLGFRSCRMLRFLAGHRLLHAILILASRGAQEPSLLPGSGLHSSTWELDVCASKSFSTMIRTGRNN
jgi:hypothetical protein